MGDHTQDTLASVYFAVPNEVVEQYGEMYAVHCTYLEAETDNIFVTGNTDVYNELRRHVGQDIDGLDLRYGFGTNRRQDMLIITYSGSYNKKKLYNGIFKHVTNSEIKTLHYVLPVDGGMDEDDSADDYVLQWDVLQEYMLDYSEGKDDLLYNRYARELFRWVAEEETEVTIEADDEYDLTSIGCTWEDFWNGNFGQDTGGTINAIQEVTSCQSAAQVKADYYLDESCYDGFKEYYDAHSEDGTVYVFHFAMDDYYSVEATELDNENALYEMDSNAYLARQTVYLNFDVIDISMKQGEDVVVLGAAASPIDVIPNLTPPVETTPDGGLGDWIWDIIEAVIALVGILLIVAVISVFWGPLSTLLGLLWQLICMPFKAIGNAIKNRKKKE